ncbi:MAG: hypothetical protein MK132_09015 [Lentisphaerales bacterium]|nr:hypothetical protein [Lentisphaerales bacterium]
MKTLFFTFVLFLGLSCDKAKPVSEVTIEEKYALEYFFSKLRKGDDTHALEILNQILTKEDIPALNKSTLSQLKPWGINKEFLERKHYTKSDLFSIKQSLFFNDLAYQFSRNQSSDGLVNYLYREVRERLSKRSGQKDQSAFPIQIWRRGFGLCDRQSWVMCELAYQAGAEAYIIYFRDPETLVSHHTICEVNYKGKSYVIDPLYGKFIEGRKFSDLKDKEIESIWKEYPRLHNDHHKAVTFIPIMAHDFTPRVQAFGELCLQVLKQKAPRIGEAPEQRLIQREMDKQEDLRIWDYPLRLWVSTSAYKEEFNK